MNGRRFVRWSPDEVALWLKTGERPRQVLITDRIPEDATVVAVRDDPDNAGGLLVFMDSREWELATQRGPHDWKRLELAVQWSPPLQGPEPGDALAAAAWRALVAYEDHVEACPECDEFRRCDVGADLGVASVRTRERAYQVGD